MYDEIPYPILVIQKFTDGKVQIDGFTTPDDGLSFYNFIKDHTDLLNLENLQLCVTVREYEPGGIKQ